MDLWVLLIVIAIGALATAALAMSIYSVVQSGEPGATGADGAAGAPASEVAVSSTVTHHARSVISGATSVTPTTSFEDVPSTWAVTSASAGFSDGTGSGGLFTYIGADATFLATASLTAYDDAGTDIIKIGISKNGATPASTSFELEAGVGNQQTASIDVSGTLTNGDTLALQYAFSSGSGTVTIVDGNLSVIAVSEA